MSEENFAVSRLQGERKKWRSDHPPGFVARPHKESSGNLNLFIWDCLIPGVTDTPWEGGYYPLQLRFPENYPSSPPVAVFDPPIPHVNIFPSGRVCLSILDQENWKPSLTVRQVLMGIQALLNSPNPDSPAHETHYRNFIRDKEQYIKNIKSHAAKWNKPTLP